MAREIIRSDQASDPVFDKRVSVLQSDTQSTEAKEAAFASIVCEFQDSLRSSVLSIVGPDRAEDVVQDTLLKAYVSIEGFEDRGDGALPGWLYKIARNTARNSLRDNSRGDEALSHTGALAFQSSSIGDPEAEHGVHETVAALAEVKPANREILLLDLMGFSLDEIAEREGVSKPSVKARLARSREDARRILTRPDRDAKVAIAVSRAA